MTESPNITSIKWTPTQQAAIGTVGRDVLVTASAGTGKTAVLSHRVVERIADPADTARADTMLVLTFTDAAAEEMRSRIAETLDQRFRQTGDGRLRRQLLLLDRAYISTIHSFCKRILTEFFYLIDLNPAFGMLGPDEQRLLKSEILEQTLEQAWADEELGKGLETLFKGRRIQPGTAGFVDRVIPLAEFLDSTVDRDIFYTRAGVLNDEKDSAYTELKKTQKKILLDKLNVCQQQLEYALALDAQHCNGQYTTGHIHDEILPVVLNCKKYLKEDRFDACNELLIDLKFGQLRKKKSIELSTEQQAQIKSPIDNVKKNLKELTDFALLCPAYPEQLAPQVRLQTQVLLGLLRCFDANYAAAKLRRNMLDFADLEQMTLKLLTEHGEVTDKLKERFEYIFVDEYQDINAPQQKLLELLSGGNNVFVVGDVKQSIYGFRQSRPEIFLRRLEEAEDISKKSNKPGRIDLGDNFRCRGEIIDFVNALFSRVMTRATADMDYNRRTELTGGFEYPDFKGPGQPVELILLAEQGSEDDPDFEPAGPTQSVTATQRQAAWIADRIQKIVGAESGRPEFQIYDKKSNTFRDVQYRDIVILMRSLSHRAQEYTEILRLAGVPVSSQSACGYFQTTEITDCLCLLKVLDNPDRDIELAAVLRGPVFGVSDDQLTAVRLNAGKKKISFYRSARKYADDGPDSELKQTLSDVLGQIHQWRQEIRIGSLADFLDRILRQKGLLSFYAALPNGAQRRANLLKLHDYAIQFEHFRTTEPGAALGRFVEFLEKLDETEQDWAPAEPDSSSENAVRVMSVHRSKGLEFGVVFVAELNSRFNMRDCSGECLIAENMLGLQVVDAAAGARFDSMAHQVIAEQKKRSSLAEEMRILYVALTRAREKLILTANAKTEHVQTVLRSACGVDRLPDWKLTEVQNAMDWILLGFGNQPLLHEAFETGEPDAPEQKPLFHLERVGRVRLDMLTAEILNAKKSLKGGSSAQPISSKTAAAMRAIERNLKTPYAFEPMTQTPAKLSVSELTHRDDAYAGTDTMWAFSKRPAVLDTTAVSADALTLGSAVHLVFEHIDLIGPCNGAAIASVVQTLVQSNRIPRALAKKINTGRIEAFFQSDLGQLARAAGEKVLREWPFTYALDTDMSGAGKGEIIVLQGIIDMMIPTETGLVIVDFKTDYVTESTVTQRTEKYAQQLCYYARAAGDILRQPVRSAWLYFLILPKALEVKLNL